MQNKSADETKALLVGEPYIKKFNKAVDVYHSIDEVKIDHYACDKRKS